MQNVKMLQRSLKQKLTRGAKVVIGESFPEPEMRGKEMVLASKSVVKCMGKGRCAHDNCIGLAAFVTEPGKQLEKGKKGDKSKNVGWRSGTAKICLTHLRTPEGGEMVPEQEETGERATIVAAGGPTNGSSESVNRVREHLEPRREETPSGGYTMPGRSTAGVDTSWEALAHAAGGREDAIVVLARALKSENEYLRERLMQTQDRLLARIGG